jgi:hypothetical protein
VSGPDALGAYSFLPLDIVSHDELGLVFVSHLSSASRCLALYHCYIHRIVYPPIYLVTQAAHVR